MTFDPTALPLPLEYKTQPNPPPRPKLRDQEVLRAAAESAMPRIIEWLAEDWREADREDYVDDLIAAVALWDGYKAARVLERKGWEPDADLVEILDDGCWGYRAHQEAQRAWVEANKIEPTYAAGDVVKTPHGVGPIVGIHLDTAHYTVQTNHYLAERPTQAGTAGGYVVAFEDVSAVEPAP